VSRPRGGATCAGIGALALGDVEDNLSASLGCAAAVGSTGSVVVGRGARHRPDGALRSREILDPGVR